MIADSSLNISIGNLTSGLEPNESVKAVINFIKTNFIDFSNSHKELKKMNEKGINQKLCIFLNKRADKCPFFFHHDFMEDINSGNSASVDIGTIYKDEKIVVSDNEYAEDDSFFSLESKRLPTPGADREKEYVIGNSSNGGIERFKKGIHGPRLKHAAILGYVQELKFEHWFSTVNSWIDELIKINTDGFWATEDKLAKVEENPKVIVLSSHSLRKRADFPEDRINLHHIWVNLTSLN